ncbi:MAG: T9SS type B sorting domain-containing protein [Weeksellaceae bacterium]|nr:T9SS type B sorting domain-containing protein [Weeksellaceae bacterium]
MKKIHNFLIALLLFITAQAQNQPTITPLTGGFTFPNQLVEEHTVAFRANTINCGMNFTRYYKYYSFQANFDMTFAFDLIANKPDFRFLIWKLPVGSRPQDIFNNNSTILPARSVEGEALIKGLKEDDLQICEGYTTSGRNGYAKGFQGTEQLLRGETIVIAVYGNNTVDAFDIKINVAEERTINTFNNKCEIEGYTYNELFSAVQANSGSSNITLYQDQNFQNILPVGSAVTSEQTIYAQVKDDSGKLIYIYTIPISFKPNYSFFFNNASYEVCGPQFIVNYDQIIRDNVTNYGDVNDFIIEYIELNGRRYADGDVISLPDHFQRIYGKVKYVGNNGCETSSNFDFSVRNIKYITDRNPIIETCNPTFTIDKLNLRLLTQVINDEDYDIKFYLPNGTEVFDGDIVSLNGNQLILNYIPVHYATGCVGTTGTIAINKTSTLPIVDANLTACLVDLKQELIDQKLTEIRNGTTANLTFYFQGSLIQSNEILNIIRTNRNGVIEVRVEEGCPTTRQFTFSINESSITLNSELIVKQEFCVDANLVINYYNQDLKQLAIQNILNPVDVSRYDFRFFDESNTEITLVNNLQTDRRIKVVVKLNSEDCSNEFFIELKRVNKLVINDSSRELTANCDDTIVFTRETLIDLFGAEVANYQTNIVLNQVYPITFGTADQVIFTVDFYQDANCVTTKEIIINKGSELNIDFTSIQQDITNNPYRFCGEINTTDLANYLSNYINQVLATYPNLQTEQAINQYVQTMTANNGVVTIKFLDPNQCGTKDLVFNYQPFPMLDLELDQNVFTCTGQNYLLDLSTYTIARVFDQNGNEIFGVRNQFSLAVGNYIVEVENQYGCITRKTLQVSTSPEPIIKEIILNLDSIEVIAQGNGGVLEYSIDGINWQRSNKFSGIQKGESYTVYVRENGCAIVFIPDVVYLNLPNFISPNGDGINDIWKPIGRNTSLDVRIQVFNRYGKIVYEAEGANALNWNGTINNRKLPSDSYWYFIEYIDTKTVIKLKYQGYITIKSNK